MRWSLQETLKPASTTEQLWHLHRKGNASKDPWRSYTSPHTYKDKAKHPWGSCAGEEPLTQESSCLLLSLLHVLPLELTWTNSAGTHKLFPQTLSRASETSRAGLGWLLTLIWGGSYQHWLAICSLHIYQMPFLQLRFWVHSSENYTKSKSQQYY